MRASAAVAAFWVRNEFRNRLDAPLRLIALDQVANALRIAFAMAVTGDGIRAASRFDPNFRPHHSSRDMHGSNFRHGNALFVAAKPARLHAADAHRAHYKASGEQKIALSPAAGGKRFGRWLGCGRGRRYTHSSAPFFQ